MSLNESLTYFRLACKKFICELLKALHKSCDCEECSNDL